MSTTTFDEKCYDLASEFLEDYSGIWHDANCRELAGVIQKAVDAWILEALDNYTPETT